MSEGKTNGKRNKSAGSNYERQVVNRLKDIGYSDVGTSRNNSRARDAAKIDVVNCNEDKNGRLPYNIQVKTLAKPAPYGKLLDEMPKDGPEINVIFHKQTKKAENGRFYEKGQYAILKLDDFYAIIKRNLELEDEAKSWSNIM
jgi:hypothetical protein